MGVIYAHWNRQLKSYLHSGPRNRLLCASIFNALCMANRAHGACTFFL